MLTSKPSTPKNPLKRHSDDCCSTDRSLQRHSKPTPKKKSKVSDTRDEVEIARAQIATAETASANRVKEEVKQMTPSQRAAWYANEKKKRSEAGQGSKRTFTDPKAFVSEFKGHENRDEEVDAWQPFRDFAIEQILLKKCDDEAGALELWKKELKTTGAKVMEARGHQLLGRFKGVEIRRGNVHGFHAGMKESSLLGDEEGILGARQHQDEMLDRFKRKSLGCTQNLGGSSSSVDKVSSVDIDHVITESERETATVLDKQILNQLQVDEKKMMLKEEEMLQEAIAQSKEQEANNQDTPQTKTGVAPRR